MRILDFKTFEAKLTFADLAKRNAGDKLVSKLQDDQLFKVGGNDVRLSRMRDERLPEPDFVPSPTGVTQISADGAYSELPASRYLATKGGERGTRYNPVFKDDADNQYSLNQLDKTKEFGSSGSGQNTYIQETIQIVLLSFKQDYPSVNLTRNNCIGKFKEYVSGGEYVGKVFTDVPITEEMIDIYQGNDDWLYTFSAVPNKLFSTTSGILPNRRRNFIYKFYHSSYSGANSPHKVLVKCVSRFLKGTHISKFCPADVYLVHDGAINEIVGRFNEINSEDSNVFELVSVMNDFFIRSLFIPLSLKMVRKNIPFEIITNNLFNTVTERILPVKFSFQKAFISQDPQNGIGSKVEVRTEYVDIPKPRQMSFYANVSPTSYSFSGEVAGNVSRGHGKISLDKIVYIFKRHGVMTENLKVTPFNELNDLDLDPLVQRLNQVHNQSLALVGQLGTQYRMGRSSNIVITGDPLTKRRIISKIHSLQIINIITQTKLNSTRLCNKVITDIFKYALSIQVFEPDPIPPVEDHVSNPVSTPNYLRVV